MGMESRPNSDYTRTWSPSGEIEYAKLADGTRLRYVKAGSGPALILLHTVRTQLDHFQLVIPKLVDAFTVFAIDMPGMGWSDITPGASYTEPALRRATVEFVKTLDLNDVTLAGESMGATVSLTRGVQKPVSGEAQRLPEAALASASRRLLEVAVARVSSVPRRLPCVRVDRAPRARRPSEGARDPRAPP
jgi:pimeloyl-ACP methyl ester carboxylesterase